MQHYYNAFDTNRASLAALYQPHSMLTFEATKLQARYLSGIQVKFIMVAVSPPCLQLCGCREDSDIFEAQTLFTTLILPSCREITSESDE